MKAHVFMVVFRLTLNAWYLQNPDLFTVNLGDPSFLQ